MSKFDQLELQESILKAIHELGFEQPTPIQEKCIPFLLNDYSDVIAFAQTGTGKTAAFGLPSIQHADLNNKNTQTLILSPTRELCIQITKDLENYSKYLKNIGIVPVYGGASVDTQIKALKKQAQIVVATPGRALDLIERKVLKIQSIRRLILDEADEMLTMGFKDELDAILMETPEDKQTLLFSATMSKEIQRITKNYMTDPVEIAVAAQNTTTSTISHSFHLTLARNKYEVLKRIADINPQIYGIVFCRTRMETKEIANKLITDGYNADALHGDLSQAQRDEVMSKFRKRTLQILVATDVAARGIDVTDLTHIIHYHLPDEAEVYIHRSGRTGRAGKTGKSVAIAHSREIRKIKDIEKKFKIKIAKEAIPNGPEICRKQLYAMIDKMENVQVDDVQIEPFLDNIYKKLEWLSREELIKRFVSIEFNRFLDYYKNAEDLNIHENEQSSKKKKKDKEKLSEKQKRSLNLQRMYLNVGSKNKLSPPRLIGLINNALDSSDAEIGKIEILKKFSFFEIDPAVSSDLAKELTGKSFEGLKLSVEIADSTAPISQNRSMDYSRKKKPSRREQREKRERRSNYQDSGSKKRKKAR